MTTPRIHAVLTIILAALLLGGLLVVSGQHGSLIMANPLIVPWFGLSVALGFAQSVSVYLLEFIFLILALCIWAVYRLQCKVVVPPR
jgi:hypothetical protein